MTKKQFLEFLKDQRKKKYSDELILKHLKDGWEEIENKEITICYKDRCVRLTQKEWLEIGWKKAHEKDKSLIDSLRTSTSDYEYYQRGGDGKSYLYWEKA